MKPGLQLGQVFATPQSSGFSKSAWINRFFFLLFIGLQSGHLGLLLLDRKAIVGSNVFQAAVPVTLAMLCAFEARQCGRAFQAKAWWQLSLAFSVWAAAQTNYLWSVVARGPSGSNWFSDALSSSTWFSDALWLLFAFPLLMAVFQTPEGKGRDVVRWLDTLQAAMFFTVLIGLAVLCPNFMNLPLAYDLQALALVLAFALRYSIPVEPLERRFYRNLMVYAILYAALSVVGYLGHRMGMQTGSLIDICWTAPFTMFGVLIVVGERTRESARWSSSGLGMAHGTRKHLRGVSALGLAMMSLLLSGMLATHRLVLGSVAVAISFLLFAARTSIREQQLRAMHTQLEDAALHDPMTGLANRTLLRKELAQRLQSGNPTKAACTAVLFIDLDRFKMFNDGLGHAFGDALLCSIAARLRAAAGAGGTVARYGGDEFAVLLADVDADEGRKRSQAVLEVLREPLMIGDRCVHITASLGLVQGSPEASADEMLQDADCAMYVAKRSGKDRMQLFSLSMLEEGKHKLSLEADLRACLKENGLQVVYQPICDALDGRILGFEALARWPHPQRGQVMPSDFIPLAEETGLIVELGRQVLRTAFAQCRSWNERYQQTFTINVNASAHQFANPEFLDEIIAILKETGLAPELLKLEVTESVLLGEFGNVEEVLSKARALGIGLALDDFGTGYSSLNYLLKLPFDVVKIDRSFVRHMNQEPRRAEMVRMVIHLAQALGMRVVAEGVETDEELSHLRELDCHMVQGYLLSRPVTGSSVEGWLEADHREWLAATSVERVQGAVAICGLLGKQLAPVELLAFEKQGDRPRLYRRAGQS